MKRRLFKDERGLAMLSVLTVVYVAMLLSALVLYLSGKEIAFSALRNRGAQGLYVAEAGATAARSALMAFMNADPIGVATMDATMGGSQLSAWFAGGTANAQIPFGPFDYIVINGQRFTINPTAATTSVTFDVNWSLATTHQKLQLAGGPLPSNSMGPGTYTASVTVTPRKLPHSSCLDAGGCAIHRLGFEDYEFFYTYSIISDATVAPQGRRRVTFSSDYSVRIRRQQAIQYLMQTQNHYTGSTPYYMSSYSNFDGPVHTNGEFAFSSFPKFSDNVTSVNGNAWFFNNNAPVELAANENVVGAVRRDAPVKFDATPGNLADDQDNLPAAFVRGSASVSWPANLYSQQGTAIGRSPTDTSAVTNLQVRQVIPELADNALAVPNGVYVPVIDSNNNGVSDANEPLAGGIYAVGPIESITLSITGPDQDGDGDLDLATYTLVWGSPVHQTVTVTVDRTAGTTTVTNTTWPVGNQTRTFTGVPKGWQGPGNDNATVIWGGSLAEGFGGTLEEQEQLTFASSGRIDITNHLRYEVPPDVTNPNHNPLNVIGIYTTNSIRIGAWMQTPPDNIDIHAVLMAGSVTDGTSSSVFVNSFLNSAYKGQVRLIGSVLSENYGQWGTFNAAGQPTGGYTHDFKYDRRLSRGILPPYFPLSTSTWTMAAGTQGLADVRPRWREAAP